MAGLKVFLFSLALLSAQLPSVFSLSHSFNELLKMSHLSKDSVIRLSDANFNAFVQTPKSGTPRNMTFLVIFDAKVMHSNEGLDLPGLRKEFGLVASSYAKNHGDAREVFFIHLEYSEAESIFRDLDVSSLPHTKVFLPGGDVRGQEMDWSMYPKKAESFAAFLKEASRIEVGEIIRPPPLSTTQIAVLGVVLALSAPFLIRILLTTRTPLHDPRLWCVSGLLIYFFSVSGGMYNIIRKMPLFYPDHKNQGKMVYFLQGGSGQLGAEGFTVGTLYTTVGLLVAFVTHGLPRIPNRMVQRVTLFICMICATYAVRQVVALEVWKSGYWVHGFWPRSWN